MWIIIIIIIIIIMITYTGLNRYSQHKHAINDYGLFGVKSSLGFIQYQSNLSTAPLISHMDYYYYHYYTGWLLDN